MGDPKKRRKQYNSPGHPYQKPRIEAELVLVGRYGLRNKRELWKARTLMGKFRAQARSILALQEEEREVQENLLISKLSRLGIVQEGTTSDEILGMEVEAILKRRLQTLVVENGLASTVQQSRQLIAHRHITINNRVITSPSYLVPISDEETLKYATNSPFNDPRTPNSKIFIKSRYRINRNAKSHRRRSDQW